MTDSDLQPTDKGSYLQDDSSYDEKQRMLESLGKFKSIETVVQVKSRSYRLQDNESLDHASNDEDNFIANDDKKVKSRTSPSSKETQDSGVKSDRSRTEKTLSRSSASRSSKDHHVGHGSSSYRSSLVSKDSGCKSSSSSHSTQDRSEPSKSSRPDDKRTKDYSSTNEKSLHRSDGSDRSKRDREKGDLDAKKERNEDLRRFEKDQTELQKRIEDLKKEISQEKSKIKEIEGRVGDTKVAKLLEDYRYSSSKVSRMESSQVSGKSRAHKPCSDSTSHSQKLERHHQCRSSDSKDTSDARRHGKEQSGSRRSHSRSLKSESSIQSYRRRSPKESEKYDNRRARAVDEHRHLNLRNSNNYRSSSRESGKERNSGLCRQRSRSPCDERRRGITIYSDKCKQESSGSSLRREEQLLSVRCHLDRGKTRNESSLENVRNYKDIQREEGRNKLNNYLKNIRSLRIFTRTSRSHSTSDLYHEKSSGCYGSPISVESFDLDWPRSPHQPGVDLRANDGYISPISQFHASGDARIFREEFCGKIVDDRVRSNSKFHSFLGQHLLAKRYDQRNGDEDIWAGRNIDCFELIQCIGKGSFGQIFKAADKDKNLMVAVKKITTDAKLGFPLSALRELNCLNLLKHPNIICLLEVAREAHEKGSPESLGIYYYVYEYVAHDLKGIIESNLVKLSPDNIACLMMQLLSALEYCHSHDLIHCNVKSSSILVSYRGQVKLTHFGLSHNLKNSKQSNQVKQGKDALLWYQAPEILLGSEVYEPSVDIWSSGCILGEMFQQKPLFASRDDLHQLCLISSLCGSPNALVWPDVTQLPRYYIIKSREQHTRRLREEFYFLPNAALDVLDALLAINPQKRCTAAKALQMDWLRDINLQRMPPIILPKTTDCHSMLNESKSETTNEAASQGVKRNFSPVPSHSSKGIEDEMESKRRKKIDPAIVRLALSNLSSAIDALHQQQIQNPQKDNPSSHATKSTLDSSSMSQSSPEQLPSTKGSMLQLRIKDYQHQTISNELSSDSSSHMPRTNEETSVRERSTHVGSYLPQKQKSSESRQSSEFVQNSTDNLRQNFSLPGSKYDSSDISNAVLSTHNDSYPKNQMSVETIELERKRTLTTAISQLTSESPAPALSESSIAFWDAMKAYCANLGTVTSEASSKSSESKKTLPKVLNPVHKACSLYPVEEFSHISSGRDARAAEPGEVSYCSHNYDSSYPPGTLHSYCNVSTNVTVTPQMHSDNANYSASYSTFSDDPRLRSFRMRMGTGYACGDMPTDEGNINSMTENNDGNVLTTRVASSSRVRVVPRRVDVDKHIIRKSASASLQFGQNSDLTNTLFDQTSKSCNPCPSAAVKSSLPPGESEAQTNLRPKLTGILKKRLDVNSETQSAWK